MPNSHRVKNPGYVSVSTIDKEFHISATHRTLAAANPEVTQLHTEVQVLQKQHADMRTRLDRLEQDGKFRLSPITETVTPR